MPWTATRRRIATTGSLALLGPLCVASPAAAQADLCTGEAMISVIAPDFLNWGENSGPLSMPPAGVNPLIASMVPGADPNPLAEWRTYEQRLNEIGGLMPSTGEIHLGGLVNDGGTACTDPVGDNVMFESMIGTMTAEELQDRIFKRLSNMTQAESDEMRASMQSAGASPDPVAQDAFVRALGFRMPAIPTSVTADLGGSAMFEIYSPNGVSWVYGDLPAPTGDRPIFEHNGTGGWLPNSAAHIWIVLPDKEVSDLRPGQSYDAIIPSFGVGDPFYSRWEGEWITHAPKLQECRPTAQGWVPEGPSDEREAEYRDTFEGTLWTVETEGLAGKVTIESAGGGQVQGSFRLSGNATMETSEYTYRHPDEISGECEYGRLDVVIGNDGVYEQQEGPINVSGTFTAPASVEVSRRGRKIAYTRTVGGAP